MVGRPWWIFTVIRLFDYWHSIRWIVMILLPPRAQPLLYAGDALPKASAWQAHFFKTKNCVHIIAHNVGSILFDDSWNQFKSHAVKTSANQRQMLMRSDPIWWNRNIHRMLTDSNAWNKCTKKNKRKMASSGDKVFVSSLISIFENGNNLRAAEKLPLASIHRSFNKIWNWISPTPHATTHGICVAFVSHVACCVRRTPAVASTYFNEM